MIALQALANLAGLLCGGVLLTAVLTGTLLGIGFLIYGWVSDT